LTYSAALTEALLAEGGTVDEFIEDSVMVFSNALFAGRSCRAAHRAVLSAEAANEALILNSKPGDRLLSPFALAFVSGMSWWEMRVRRSAWILQRRAIA
jgi:hypothetical protein